MQNIRLTKTEKIDTTYALLFLFSTSKLYGPPLRKSPILQNLITQDI